MRNLKIIAFWEVRKGIESLWVWALSLAIILLVGLALSLGKVSIGGVGFVGTGKLIATLVNLFMLFIPLFTLVVGALSIVPSLEDETFIYIYSHPITKTQYLLGNLLGKLILLIGAIVIGFSVASIGVYEYIEMISYLHFVVTVVLLATVGLTVGFFVSAISKSTTVAISTVILVWIIFVLLGDLALLSMGILFSFSANKMLFCALINPLQVFKLLSVYSIDSNLELFGPVALYSLRLFGDSFSAVMITILLLWIVVPILATLFLFERRDVVG